MATFPTLTTEVAFGATPTTESALFDDSTRGLFDTAKFGASDSYVDISADHISIIIDRGRQRRLEQYRTGTSKTKLRNKNFQYDPNNLAGPYVAGGVSQVEAMRRVRHRATYAGITYTLFGGYSDDWVPDRANEFSPVTDLSASELTKSLAGFNPDASAPVGAGENSGTRIHRILDNAGIPTSDRLVDTGNSTVQATTLAQNALTECFLTADSEGGAFYCLADGRANFDRRHAVYEDARMRDSQATFDNQGGLPYTDVTPRSDVDRVKNAISLARVGGTAQTATDAASIAKYFERSHRRTDLILESDDDVLLLAQALLFLNKDREARFDQIQLNPVMDAALWPVVLGLELRSQVTVVDRVGAAPVTKRCFVEGIRHQIVPPMVWSTTLWLSSATPYIGSLIFDHATLGKLGTGTFAPW